MAEGEKLIPINIEEAMKSAYIDYSMSVIVSRALPDVRDGLKPVHRRVLYGMHELGVRSTSAHKKSARIRGALAQHRQNACVLSLSSYFVSLPNFVPVCQTTWSHIWSPDGAPYGAPYELHMSSI